MKRLIIFIFALVAINQMAFSQKLYKESTSVRVPNRYSSPDMEYTYKYVDGEIVRHGAVKINDKIDYENIGYCSGYDTFTLSANYTNGLLNGSFTMSHKGNWVFPNSVEDYDDWVYENHRYTSSLSASFKNGVLDGAIKARSTQETGEVAYYTDQNNSRYAYMNILVSELTCTYKNGKLVGAFNAKHQDGLQDELTTVISGTLTSEGKPDGVWKIHEERWNFKNGIDMDYYEGEADLKDFARSLADNRITLEQLEKKYCISATEYCLDLESTVDEIVFDMSPVPWNDIEGFVFSSDSDKLVTYKSLFYLPTISDEQFNLYLSTITPKPIHECFINSSYACKGITINDEVRSYCQLPEGYDIVYLTETQSNKLVEVMGLKYEQYLKEQYQENLNNLVGTDKQGSAADFFKAIGCSEEQISKMTPIVGYKCNETSKVDSTIVLRNEINVANESGIGYKTYKWDLYINVETSVVDIEKSFNLIQIPNEYDTINELNDSLKVSCGPILVIAEKALEQSQKSYCDKYASVNKIDHQNLSGTIEKMREFLHAQQGALAWMNKSAELKGQNDKLLARAEAHTDIFSSYSDAWTEIDCSWTMANDYSSFDKLEDLQKRTMEFISLRDEIVKNENAIRESGAETPSILTPYSEFVAQADLTWTPSVDIEKLQKHIRMQQQTQKLITNNTLIRENSDKIRNEGAAHTDVITAYNEYICSDIVWTPDVDVDVASTENILNVQNKTIRFVQLRNKIVENDAVLKENSSAGKVLYKLYSTNRKTVVLTWTADVDMTGLETLITIQENCKTMLSYNDIKTICRSIQKDKIKDVKIAIEKYKK